MDKLAFSNNWNGKLNCQYFTTIRLQSKKFTVGNLMEVTLRGQRKGIVKVVDVKLLKLDQINSFIAGLDTGLSADDCKAMIRKMYRTEYTISWERQLLSFALLAYEKEEKAPTLFDVE